jgi:CubicO group peptidase (beta-lactamase class C family)
MLDVERLKKSIPRYMEEFQTRGLQIGVISNGQILYKDSFGVIDRNNAPINCDTRMGIGSTTKAFASAGLAILVDQGKLRWDDTIISHIPEFKMYDDYVTHNLTVRDILSHRSGLARHDLIWYGSQDTDTWATLKKLQWLEPSIPFRTGYLYQNMVYGLAGYLTEVISGIKWGDYIEANIFKPLNMSRTAVDLGQVDYDNRSWNYAITKEGIVDLPRGNVDVIPAAGAIVSSVNDMLRWLQFQLDEGQYEGRQLISRKNLLETHRPNTIMTEQYCYDLPFMRSMAYGMGWRLKSYRGRQFVEHTGGIDGFGTLVALLPEEKLGVYICTNSPDYTSFFYYGIMGEILDELLGDGKEDWFEIAKRERNVMIETMTKKMRDMVPKQIEGTSPSSKLGDYIGEYKHKAYGIVRISALGDGLAITFRSYGNDPIPLNHYHYDTFCLGEGDMVTPVHFVRNAQGIFECLYFYVESELANGVRFDRNHNHQ